VTWESIRIDLGVLKDRLGSLRDLVTWESAMIHLGVLKD